MKKRTQIIVTTALFFLISVAASAQWTTSGANIYNSNTGNVGIGTSSPSEKLHVSGNILVGGTISIPGTGTSSQRFGPLSSATGNYTTAVGNSATATAEGSTSLGYNANATGFGSTAIGTSAKAYNLYNTTIGYGATANATTTSTVIGATAQATANGGIAIGYAAISAGGVNIGSGAVGGEMNIGASNVANGFNTSMLIGSYLNAGAANQIVLGNGLAGFFKNDIRFNGVSNNLAASYGPLQLHALEGAGANSTGQSMSIYPGAGTGSATGGDFIVYGATAGAAGTTTNTYTERIKATATGNVYLNNKVAIATTNIPADYKLAVGGNIIAEKLRVKLQSSGWPDYVFANDYNLRPLQEVEQFISQHKHLPDVPSAKQVGEEGVDVGDNQAVLLKKIEELTLYLIEQNKTIETIKAELKTLKEKQ